MECKNCGATSDSKFCPYCGSQMPVDEVSKIDNSTTIINNYYASEEGEKSSRTDYSTKTDATYTSSSASDKSRIVALILCVFLGSMGVHQFYAGKIGMGILYLFTCGLFGIGWVVDIFLIAFGRMKDSQGKFIVNI